MNFTRKVFSPLVFVLIIFLTFTPTKNLAQTSDTLTLGVTYDEALAYLEDDFSLEEKDSVDGLPRFKGISKDSVFTLELIGNKENLSQATLTRMISEPKEVNAFTVVIPTRFLINFVPELDRPSIFPHPHAEWLIELMKTTPIPGETVEIIGDKRVEYFNVTNKILFITVRHKDAVKDEE